MWRDWTTHQPKETVFLDEVVDRSIGRLQLLLDFLRAVVEEKIHLAEIEELRREKMFLGEIDEVEETMKEKIASLEVFVLTHELGKSEVEHGYSHQIVKKDYRTILEKTAEDFRLPPEDTEDVFHLILLHEKVFEDFSRAPSKATYDFLVRYCQKYGRDADDFLDLLLAVVLLLGVVDRKSELKAFFNFLSAERVHSPDRSAVRLQAQAEKKKKAERARLREAGLDGNELMKLLDMKPGPEFGKMLAAIHAFARGEAEAPEVAAGIKTELFNRAVKFRSL